jgi:Tol biopolymer transport system component
MPLSPGTRLGAFEIVVAIGAGGMGEVYRARDTRLHRDVALKVLSEAVALDSDRLARFEREAVTLAALNHPNIAQIYGSAEGETQTALVMEFVDGEDLAARLTRGPMPVDEALVIGRQVAEALDAAHSAGIVHRDLKPANVKVRSDGVVKVLDFGLAKALAPAHTGTLTEAAGFSPANSPTITSPGAVTGVGMILGTAAYMSPEQARGRTVDRRADIWSFGCLVFELLTGRAAFEGETVTDILGSIVKSEPDWGQLPAATPPAVQRLLRRCLQKDPVKRLRDIGDAIAELDPMAIDAAPVAHATEGARARDRRSSSRGLLAAAWIASLAVAAAGAAAIGVFTRPAPEARLQKFHLAIQEDGGAIREPAISPDGRQIAYVGRSRIWVQSIDQWKPRELAGTEEAMRPFWSPAGDWIAYFRSENLFKVPVNGGPIVRIASLRAVQAPFGSASGVWKEDGTIVISQAAGVRAPILQVSNHGGDPVAFGGALDGSIVDLHDLHLLPGGHILAAVHRENGTAARDNVRVDIDALGVLTAGGLRVVLEASNVANPAYSPSGHVIYQRQFPNAGLWAVPFSLDRLEVTGEPFLIGEGVAPSMARDGTLAFLGQAGSLVRQLSWITMDGRVGARVAEPREWTEGVAISADGQRVLASTTDGIWAYQVETGARSRVTNDSSDITPVWIDRDAIAFVRTVKNEPVVLFKRLGGDGEERVLARGARFPYVTADGRRISFNIADDKRERWQVGWIDLDRGPEIHRLGPVHDGARFPSISPDGRLVAYISGEMGRDEVFLTTLPSGEGKWQISTEGGGWTRITPRGDAVVFRAPDASFMSAPISVAGGVVKIGQPRKLFDWGAGWHLFYDLARDGMRGVAAVPLSKSSFTPSISVVQHWDREFSPRQR